MADPQTLTPIPPPAPAARGLRIALAVSVALNLGVAGLALGAWLAEGPHRGMPRDMAFGPFSEALTEQDRRALRQALSERAGEFRTSRAAAEAEFGTLLATLRATPFDPSALTAALAAIEARNAERLELGRSLIETRLIAMTEAERLAFADRLERGLRRGGKKKD
jgi:uncharacterized membrane protein